MNAPDLKATPAWPPHLVDVQGIPGSNRTFRATDRLRDRQVVLKWSRTRPETTALGREWLLLCRLQTGRFARPLEFRHIDREQAYLTSERIDGPTIAESFPRLDAPARLRAVHSALEALDGMHRAGIVHGDLRPENLVVRRADQRLYLLDLEYARAVDRLSAGMTYVAGWNTDLPQTGQMQSARSDLRTLGALLTALLQNDRDESDSTVGLRTFAAGLCSDYDLELLADAGEALLRLRSIWPEDTETLPDWQRPRAPSVAIERRGCTARWASLLSGWRDRPQSSGLRVCGPPAAGKRTFLRLAAGRHALAGASVQCLVDEPPGLLSPERAALLLSLIDDSGDPPLIVMPPGSPEDVGHLVRRNAPGGTCVVSVHDDWPAATTATEVWEFQTLNAREWWQWLHASV